MSQHDTMVAVCAPHDAAEAAIRKVAEAGRDITPFSIVTKTYLTEEKGVGVYGAGDHASFWGNRAACWKPPRPVVGGRDVAVPVIGPVVALGQVATLVFTALAGAIKRTVYNHYDSLVRPLHKWLDGRAPRLGPDAAYPTQAIRDQLIIEHKRYVDQHGIDMPEVQRRPWPVDPPGRR